MYISSPHPVEVDQEVISTLPINVPAIFSAIHDPKAGAVVLFSGEVRNHSHGKHVSHLEYEAYEPMAIKMIKDIVGEAKEKWELHQAICIHRTGSVAVGESAVLVITCSSHRENAYAANRYIIDRVKHEAPIWKKEFFEDGTFDWGHNCSCFNH
jgi:molybdopterin synthase catalytic subunit